MTVKNSAKLTLTFLFMVFYQAHMVENMTGLCFMDTLSDDMFINAFTILSRAFLSA